MNLLLPLVLFFAPTNDTLLVKVVKVRDGDTIEVSHKGKIIVVRLHGVDSPDRCQAYYDEAKAFATTTLLNRSVKFVPTGTDFFERSVGEIFCDAQNTSGEYSVWFNAALVGAGAAWHWPKYSNSPDLIRLHQTAKTMKVGLWAQPNATPPWEHRKTDAYKNCNSTY